MKPVKNFSGKWDQTQKSVQFSWDLSGLGNDRYIYIVGLKSNNGTLGVDMTRYRLFDIRNMNNSQLTRTSMNMENIKIGVFKMMFCAYSTETAMNISEEDIIKACLENPSYITTVMMGYAKVSYALQESVVDNSKIVKITVKSDSDISAGVLGYSYTLDGNYTVTNEIPDAVSKGKTVYPPIVIPKGSKLKIVPIEKQFDGNIIIDEKKNTLFF